MSIKKDGSPNLTRSIVEDLGGAIVTHEYPVGSAIPLEADLCKKYDVSRPIVREAVKMLTAKGLLVARQRRGTTVLPEDQWSLLDPDVLRWILGRTFSLKLLIDFTQMRLAIEPRAAALAAQTSSGEQRKDISAAIDRMFAAERGEDDPLESDISFHVAVLRASNNRFLQQFTDLSEASLRFSIRQTNTYKGVAMASVREHKAVADAILRGEAEEASAHMVSLIEGALGLLMNAAGDQATR